MKYEALIKALDKYEKNTGYFVGLIPKNGAHEHVYDPEFEVKPNCACVLGVYLIELKGVSPDEIANARSCDGKITNLYDILYNDLGVDMTNELWHINDNITPGPEDETFGKVIEYLKNAG